MTRFQQLCGAIVLTLALALSACGSAAPEPEVAPESTEDAPALAPAAGEGSSTDDDLIFEPETAPESYPPPPTPLPTPEGYPALPTSPPLPGAYDDIATEGPVWVLFPVGEQCADPAESRYQDLAEAEAALTAAGITVFDAEMVDLLVCQACGCPTSAHYRVQIDGAQLGTAVSLDWFVENAESDG